MVLRNTGSLFEFEDQSFPSLVTTVSGSKLVNSRSWKLCPYSTQSTVRSFDERVPEIEKVYHGETNGQMHSYSIGIMGWVCADNGCSFFLGSAVTEVDQRGRRFCAATEIHGANELATLSGTAQLVVGPRTIVSGTRYLEI